MILLDKPKNVTCHFCGANLNLTPTTLYSDARLIGKNKWACFSCAKEADIKSEGRLHDVPRYK